MNDNIGRQGSSKRIREPLSVAKDEMERDRRELYEFGPFRLEPAERKLWRGNEIVVLTPKAFDTLVFLVRNSGHLLEKDQLIRTLWPDSFVEEGNLTSNISLLRKALGDDPAYIETVPKRGYRFVGAVHQLPRPGARNLARGWGQQPELAKEFNPEKHPSGGSAAPALSTERWSRRTLALITLTGLVLLVVAASRWSPRKTRSPDSSRWIQLTNFPDSVTQPVLSADGRMLAFVRGYSTWVGPGQIYIKMLPGGEPVQLTHDATLKTDPTFSPDGSQIAYTTLNLKDFSWDTVVSPTLGGGDPRPLLRNASGLTWIGPKDVMFSEIKAGVHMGIVAAGESRLGARDVYLPADEPAMVHRSYLSPDRKWVLLVEMDKDHYFLPCRLVPMDGSSQGQHVGPLGGSCLSAAWSPDGKWMYFTAKPGGVSHIWRQQFPDGRTEQLTSGPTEEDGIAMAPDGQSFVTSVALQSTSLWVHDAKGERQVSLEGNGTNPKFTPDSKKLCYLVAKEATNDFAWYRNPGELHCADLQSGRSEPFQRGFPIQDYDISADGQRVVMWTTGRDGKSQFWVAPLDRSSAPVQVPNVEGSSPMFGPDGDIIFRRVEKTSTFVYRVHSDGTNLRKALTDPIFVLVSVSPVGKWIVGWAPRPGNGPPAIQAFPLDGGPAVVIGPSHTFLGWSLDGRSALLAGSYLVPVPAGESLPRIPKGGFQSDEEIAALPGARRIEGGGVVLGPSADVYAFYRGTIQRNLYRIPIP
jgi:DNA-binding winged helix-turn-helix (wHTH) protein/Tol biopolymer transport system component